VTLQQKLGSYNSYWRRVMRQIEQGTYARDIQRVSRKAARTGEDVPEELLVKLPKRIQDKIRRDRAALAEAAIRQGKSTAGPEQAPTASAISARAPASTGRPGTFTLDDTALDDGEIDSMFE